MARSPCGRPSVVAQSCPDRSLRALTFKTRHDLGWCGSIHFLASVACELRTWTSVAVVPVVPSAHGRANEIPRSGKTAKRRRQTASAAHEWTLILQSPACCRFSANGFLARIRGGLHPKRHGGRPPQLSAWKGAPCSCWTATLLDVGAGRPTRYSELFDQRQHQIRPAEWPVPKTGRALPHPTAVSRHQHATGGARRSRDGDWPPRRFLIAQMAIRLRPLRGRNKFVTNSALWIGDGGPRSPPFRNIFVSAFAMDGARASRLLS